MLQKKPSHWAEVPIGEILKYRDEQVVFDDMAEYITITVKRRHGGLEAREKLFGHEIKTKKQYRLHRGAFIISRVQCWHAAFAIVPDDIPENMIASQNYDQFEISPKVDRRFFWWLSHSPQFIETVRSSASGVVIEKLVFNRDAWLQKTIPIPPLDEQRRIVTRIESVAAPINKARRLRQEADVKAGAFYHSALAAAIPWDTNTVSLLETIEEGTKISYGVLMPGADMDDGIPLVRIQDINLHNPAPKPNKRIAPEISAQYKKTLLQGGEILVGVVGATIGKIGIAPKEWKGANIARAVCRIIPSKSVETKYLAYVLQSPPSQKFFRDATRTLAQPTLNVRQLEQTPIPVPPLDEQRRIVAYLDSVQARLASLRELQSATQEELDALLPSVLDRAFKGEL